MKEVVAYLEEPKSGVLGFTQMKPGWTEVASKISDGAAGDVDISPDFARKTVEMSVTLDAPMRKNTRPQITWLKNQLRACERKNPELFAELQSELWVDIDVKYGKGRIRIPLVEIDQAHEKMGVQEIKSFGVVQAKHFGRTFESRKRFVDVVESMLLKYYRGVVQHLKRWEKPVPQLAEAPGDADGPVPSSAAEMGRAVPSEG